MGCGKEGTVSIANDAIHTIPHLTALTVEPTTTGNGVVSGAAPSPIYMTLPLGKIPLTISRHLLKAISPKAPPHSTIASVSVTLPLI